MQILKKSTRMKCKFAIFSLFGFVFNYAQVGINTTTPAATLDVNGAVRITNLPIGNPATNRPLGYGNDNILREIPLEFRKENVSFSVAVPEAHSYALLKNANSLAPFPASFIGSAGTFKYAIYDSSTNQYIDKNYFVKYEVTEFIVGNLNLQNRSAITYGGVSYTDAVAFPQNELTNNNKSTVMTVKYKLYSDAAFTTPVKIPFTPLYRFLAAKLDYKNYVVDDVNLPTVLQSTLKSIDENSGEFVLNITRTDHMILGWKYPAVVDVMLIKNL